MDGLYPLHVKRKSQKFIHAKIYVIDERFVATGSLNFTRQGFWDNVEHVIYHEGEELRSVIEQFEDVWRRTV